MTAQLGIKVKIAHGKYDRRTGQVVGILPSGNRRILLDDTKECVIVKPDYLIERKTWAQRAAEQSDDHLLDAICFTAGFVSAAAIDRSALTALCAYATEYAKRNPEVL